MVGVLALQGDFEAHLAALGRAGVAARAVRTADEIRSSDGLVIPGGESTTFRKLMEGTGVEDAIRDVAGRGDAVLGTCAGAILLAETVTNPPGEGLGLLAVEIERNAYGRQLDSTVLRLTDVDRATLGEAPLEAVFIRAPRITATGRGVEILARRDGDPVLVRKRNVVAATFHPELTDDRRVLDIFVSARVRNSPR
ncbi:MAG TPA: pyridoxal 5'-phosphate synthase glutaminase subunit PdxT [Thermoanaerobaculia bacterium]|nr:pyridoxal 5'-phosphate synthase glutaminase subunit PdxT [Thermoanaerobaculia bacterium]